MGERMNGGAVIDERSPENPARLQVGRTVEAWWVSRAALAAERAHLPAADPGQIADAAATSPLTSAAQGLGEKRPPTERRSPKGAVRGCLDKRDGRPDGNAGACFSFPTLRVTTSLSSTWTPRRLPLAYPTETKRVNNTGVPLDKARPARLCRGREGDPTGRPTRRKGRRDRDGKKETWSALYALHRVLLL